MYPWWPLLALLRGCSIIRIKSFTVAHLKIWACFLSLARSKLRLHSANHRPGYWSNLSCDWPRRACAYSEQKTENKPWFCFYLNGSAWSVDQGSNKNLFPVHNFAHIVPKSSEKPEGQAHPYLDGLMQERLNSSALAMELRLSCTDPSI